MPPQYDPLERMQEGPDIAAETGEIVLKAEEADGHDPAWEARWQKRLRTWGIRGSKKEEEGEISVRSISRPDRALSRRTPGLSRARRQSSLSSEFRKQNDQGGDATRDVHGKRDCQGKERRVRST